MAGKRKHFSPDSKVGIFKEHLVNNVPVLNLGDKYDLQPCWLRRRETKAEQLSSGSLEQLESHFAA